VPPEAVQLAEYETPVAAGPAAGLQLIASGAAAGAATARLRDTEALLPEVSVTLNRAA
jgi:hypothetical protein